MSDDYQAEIAFLGMASSPSFVRQPEYNDYVSHCTSFALSSMSLPSDNLRENFTDSSEFQELRARDRRVWCDSVHATISRD